MIESIELEKCTGCGICDVVCPADVIHMEPQPVASRDRGAAPDQAAAGHQVPRALHHLLQLRNLLPGAHRRRASVGEEPAAALVSADGQARRHADRHRRAGDRRAAPAACSPRSRAKRHGPPGTRVTLVDSWLIGRTGHTAFSNAWTIVALPGDDIDGILHEIVAGNDGIADQVLVRAVAGRLARAPQGLRGDGHALRAATRTASYKRRPTRGLDLARVMYPEGGGLEFAWKLRLALEAEGVQLIDRLFVTGLMRGGGGRITGAVGINSRTGEFNVIKARATIVATNAITFRSGFVRDITGTGTLLAYRAGASAAQRRVLLRAAGHAEVLFRGHHLRDPGGRAAGSTPRARRSCTSYEPEWGDEADVPRIARAMAMENRKGNAPLYLDMSAIPEHLRDYFIQSKVQMDGQFLPQARRRSQDRHVRQDAVLRAQPDDQDGHPHRRRTAAPTCRGCLSAGLAQAGCANHFAGFHIGLCVGNGWIAGRSRRSRTSTGCRRRARCGRGAGAARRDARAAECRRPRRNPTASCAICRR